MQANNYFKTQKDNIIAINGGGVYAGVREYVSAFKNHNLDI